MNILVCNNLSKNFGKFAAINDVNFTVQAKDLLAVIGPNGAGKSTLFNLISGRYAPSAGDIYFKGEKISGLPAYKIVKKGISKSWQVINLFPDMSVFNNLRIGVLSKQKRDMNLFKDVNKIQAVTTEVHRILKAVRLNEKANIVAHALSHGDQKCLEIAMALSAHPELLLLDEPTAGMSPEETEYMVQLIKNLWEATGSTIIFTEHDLKVVFSISTRIVVLQMGRVIAEGPSNEIKQNKLVREAYLGESV
jgi:branched-chain amino acid transport system ATP-binding protein